MGKTGPKPWTPTKKQRELVKLWIAGGISEPVIAHKLGVCQNTLRRHCAAELDFGRDVMRADNLERLDKAASDGNVAAMKHLDAKFERVSAEASFMTDPAKSQVKVGKKEEAAIAASTAGAGSEWGDDLGVPTTRVN